MSSESVREGKGYGGGGSASKDKESNVYWKDMKEGKGWGSVYEGKGFEGLLGKREGGEGCVAWGVTI